MSLKDIQHLKDGKNSVLFNICCHKIIWHVDIFFVCTMVTLRFKSSGFDADIIHFIFFIFFLISS